MSIIRVNIKIVNKIFNILDHYHTRCPTYFGELTPENTERTAGNAGSALARWD